MRKRMLVTVPSLAATAFVTYVVPALAVTDPGQGTAPPTAGAKIDTIVSWIAWLTFAACLVGVLVSAIGLAFDKGGYGGGRRPGAHEAALVPRSVHRGRVGLSPRRRAGVER